MAKKKAPNTTKATAKAAKKAKAVQKVERKEKKKVSKGGKDTDGDDDDLEVILDKVRISPFQHKMYKDQIRDHHDQ